jgi:hypothetical protein
MGNKKGHGAEMISNPIEPNAPALVSKLSQSLYRM